jgi:hypothetical protein
MECLRCISARIRLPSSDLKRTPEAESPSRVSWFSRSILGSLIRCRPKMNMSAFTKIASSHLGEGVPKKLPQSGQLVAFLERPACAPLRQSQAFSQTLVFDSLKA